MSDRIPRDWMPPIGSVLRGWAYIDKDKMWGLYAETHVRVGELVMVEREDGVLYRFDENFFGDFHSVWVGQVK